VLLVIEIGDAAAINLEVTEALPQSEDLLLRKLVSILQRALL
jgi:hypothetical protein